MRNYFIILSLIILIVSLNCEKKKEPNLAFLPIIPESKLTYISYVTNQKNEILHEFEYFDRQYIFTDTINTRLFHYYLDRNRMSGFFTDDSGMMWNKVNIDLSAISVGFGFKYQDSLYFSYWKPVIKINKDVGAAWSLKADTTFSVEDMNGKEHTIKYSYSGNASYKGWTETTVAENRTAPKAVRHVEWNDVNYFLYDQTTGDSLIVQNGKASDYFEPELGLIRSTVDYTLKVKDKPGVFQKSTWELSSKLIPEAR